MPRIVSRVGLVEVGVLVITILAVALVLLMTPLWGIGKVIVVIFGLCIFVACFGGAGVVLELGIRCAKDFAFLLPLVCLAFGLVTASIFEVKLGFPMLLSSTIGIALTLFVWWSTKDSELTRKDIQNWREFSKPRNGNQKA